MAKRDSLRAYQDEILKRMEDARVKGADQAQLLFGFRSMQMNFLISGNDVIQLAAATILEPIPVAKPWVAGVANVKGSVYTVTDFSALLGGERIKRGKFILLSGDVMPSSALFIEGLTGLYDQSKIGAPIDDQKLKSMPQWVVSCFEIGGDSHYLIDAEQMANDHRFSKLQSGEN